ncbi:two-component system sensor histidine kinase CreC [Rhodoferax mekongensis]|uniref:two-component system sensor histidine kinase CreC n=1 Tax=Rhodoferax mekongensis TaxID=3068341 RepID=UPI0028BD76A2|nr:two-component system sensor histidine kinase CreC [Rhodoferax sp. TBRC 17199]MDT7513776.1 two-component system sensor histidine kinase CreC [Rhodoferax sp. TBRC 17199]
MSKRSRIFFGLLLIYAIGMAAVLYRVVSDLDPRYRESAEESLVETSQLLATLIEQDVRDGAIDTARLDSLFKSAYAREFSAQIFSVNKTKVELRAYVTNRNGLVLFDSTGQSQGKDFSQWRDVQLTLKGEYGARTSLDIPGDPNSAVMYMAAPVRWTSNTQGEGSGEIIGAVTVGKPVQTFGQFVAAARSRTLYAGLISVLAVLVLAVMVSMWLVRPFGLIADYARYIKAQQGFHPGRLLRRAWDLMRAAYDEMRDALAGRNYVADYVQTLTHEVKSPLSAIRGAAELLQEPMEEAQRQRFLTNIQRETQRIQEMVDRMMELTALETRRVLDTVQPVALLPLLDELAHASHGVATQRGCRITVAASEDVTVEADPFLLRRAVSNLLDNALDFSPEGGHVELGLQVQGRWAQITVRDQGPGIPGYAQDKVFEKFYSLARPHTKKKSTGLGLSFVKEIASLHRGKVELGNTPEAEGPGACAVLWLPRRAE